MPITGYSLPNKKSANASAEYAIPDNAPHYYMAPVSGGSDATYTQASEPTYSLASGAPEYYSLGEKVPARKSKPAYAAPLSTAPTYAIATDFSTNSANNGYIETSADADEEVEYSSPAPMSEAMYHMASPSGPVSYSQPHRDGKKSKKTEPVYYQASGQQPQPDLTYALASSSSESYSQLPLLIAPRSGKSHVNSTYEETA